MFYQLCLLLRIPKNKNKVNYKICMMDYITFILEKILDFIITIFASMTFYYYVDDWLKKSPILDI